MGEGISMPPPLDIVQDSRLETEFLDGSTIHSFVEPSGRNRRVSRKESWRLERHLGRGGFGHVQLERCTAGKSKDAMRAVKIINKQSGYTRRGPVDLNRELEAIAKFSHNRYNSWFVKSFGWFEDLDSIFIAMEYCHLGDLHHYLLREQSLSIADTQQLVYQIIEGLHQMHENGFAHRDLKPGNILIKSKPPTENWWIVLADFGISKREDEANGPTTAIKGTDGFMAPELLGIPNPAARPRDILGSKATDMWALGEIAFRMLTGEATFQNPVEFVAYCQGQRTFPSDRLPVPTGDDGKSFISSLMKIYPSDRMTTAQGLDHSWIRSQRFSIEEEIANLNVERTDSTEVIRPDTIEVASATWTTRSDVETQSPWTAKRIPANPPLLYREGSEQSRLKERHRDSSVKQDPDEGFKNRALLQTLKGHTGDVQAVVFSPDGKTLASGSGDKTVRLWDSQAGAVLQKLKGHTSYVMAVAFSPDGNMLASASFDCTVRLWHGRLGTALQTLRGHTYSVQTVAFSPNGKTLASGSGDSTIRLWDSQSGAALQALTGHMDSVWAVAFSPGDKMLASASSDDTIRLWDCQSGVALQTLKAGRNTFRAMAFSPDGKTLASASFDCALWCWDSQSGEMLQRLKGHRNCVNAVAFSPDGNTLASGSNDSTIRLWDSRSGAALQTLTDRSSAVMAIAFSPDGKTLASGSWDETIRLWG